MRLAFYVWPVALLVMLAAVLIDIVPSLLAGLEWS